jgi:hypothetical protein
MAISTVLVQGIQVTISPYYSTTTGFSTKASILGTFDQRAVDLIFAAPVRSFTIDALGSSRDGGFVYCTNESGAEVARVPIPSNNDKALETVTVTVSDGNKYMTKARLYAPTATVLKFSNLQVEAYKPPVTVPPTGSSQPTGSDSPFTPIPLPPPIVQPTSVLRGFISFNPVVIEATYLKNSLVVPAPQTIAMKNTSTNVDMEVWIRTLDIVALSPNHFFLPRQSTQQITVTLDAAKVNDLAEGFTVIQPIFSVVPSVVSPTGTTPTDTPGGTSTQPGGSEGQGGGTLFK